MYVELNGISAFVPRGVEEIWLSLSGITYHVHVIRLELPERGFDTQFQALCTIATIIASDPVGGLAVLEVRGVFSGDDHLVSSISFLHPFTNPDLGLFILVVSSSINYNY
jgi:hypothetical protein